MKPSASPSRDLDAVLAALADPTRRAIMERLAARGELAVGDIAEPFKISAPAISRHLHVLERAGLIERRIDKQWRKVRARPDALEPLGNWISRQHRHWSNALDRLEALAAMQIPETEKVMSNAAQDGRVLHLERLIAAPPEHLFDLWTDPEMLVRWWGPDGFDIPACDMDVRPGGKWRTTMRSPEGKLHIVSGVYRAIEPPRRLVFTWGWDDDNGARGHETEVVVTFEPAPGGTRLSLTQQTFESKDSCDNHGKGWSSSFDCLTRLV